MRQKVCVSTQPKECRSLFANHPETLKESLSTSANGCQKALCASGKALHVKGNLVRLDKMQRVHDLKYVTTGNTFELEYSILDCASHLLNPARDVKQT